MKIRAELERLGWSGELIDTAERIMAQVDSAAVTSSVSTKINTSCSKQIATSELYIRKGADKSDRIFLR